MALSAKEWTLNGLSVELKMDRRTLVKRLKGLKPHRVNESETKVHEYYWMSDVVGHLIHGGEKLDAAQEAAKLNQARRTKVEIETLIMKGDLCRTEDVEQYWFNATSAAKNRLLAMPTTLAHLVLSASTYGEVERIIKDAVYEALAELAGHGSPDPAPGTEASKGEQVERVGYAE